VYLSKPEGSPLYITKHRLRFKYPSASHYLKARLLKVNIKERKRLATSQHPPKFSLSTCKG
jgi:hypothetical protein